MAVIHFDQTAVFFVLLYNTATGCCVVRLVDISRGDPASGRRGASARGAAARAASRAGRRGAAGRAARRQRRSAGGAGVREGPVAPHRGGAEGPGGGGAGEAPGGAGGPEGGAAAGLRLRGRGCGRRWRFYVDILTFKRHYLNFLAGAGDS